MGHGEMVVMVLYEGDEMSRVCCKGDEAGQERKVGKGCCRGKC